MDRNDINWEGNFTAVVTPFTKTGEIDEGLFKKNVSLLIEEGIDGVVVTGDTGEFWSLSDDEITHVHKLAIEAVAGRVPVICGTIQMRTDTAVKLSKRAKKIGADGVMVTPSPWIRPDEKEIQEHYRRISDEADIPILVYNIPKRASVTISPELLVELCDIDNVVAVKQSAESFDDVMETVRLCGEKIRILAGHSVTRGFPCVMMGTDGFVSSVETQIMGKEAVELYQLSVSGKSEVARKLQYKLIELDHAVHGIGTFPSALKAAMNLRGRPGGYTRSPVLPLGKSEIERLRNVLSQLGLL